MCVALVEVVIEVMSDGTPSLGCFCTVNTSGHIQPTLLSSSLSLNSCRDCEMVVLDEVSSGVLTSLGELVVEAGAVEMPLAPSCRVTLAVGIDRGQRSH